MEEKGIYATFSLEEWHDLAGELLGGAESLAEEHHLGDELPVG